MAKKKQDPLAPQLGFHPQRAIFVLPNRVISEGERVFDNPGADVGHSGLNALLKVPGVAIVALRRNRVTVLRDPEAEWDAVLPAVQDVLRTFFWEQPPYEPPASDEDRNPEAEAA